MCDNSAFINLFLEETSLTSTCLRSNLKYVDESRAFQNEFLRTENSKISDLVSAINTKLHAASNDRLKALLLLETLLSQCPVDVYNKHYAVWLQQCSKWSQHTIDDELRILRGMIDKTVPNPEVKKHITTYVLPRFVDRLSNVNNVQKSSQTIVNTLRCLASFIHGYSSSCGPHRGIFQKYVLHCLTEHQSNMNVIREAAPCFVALCECGTKGQQSINFKEAWSSKFTSLVNTCHKLLDSLYSNVNYVGLVAMQHIEEFLSEFVDSTEMSEITPLKRYHRLLKGFAVVVELLRAMLLCKYSTCKSFRPNDLLNLVCRILSVTGTVLEKCVQTNDILALAAVLPQLHEHAFRMIEALITSGRRNLIPYGSLICKICLQSLKWTHSNDWPYGSQKPLQSLRSKVYSILSSWMSVAGSSSSIEVFADEVIPIIVADIEFVKPSVKLTVTTKSKKGKSRKRNHLVTEMNMQSDSPVLIDQKANVNVCAAAHQTLQLLLRSASVLIKGEHHNYLHSVILLLMKDMYSSLSMLRYPLPYADNECRRHLFASLLLLVQEPHPKSISPLNLAIRFFEMGALDENAEVASFCKSALCQLEASIHPRCPTLYFSQDAENTSSKFTSNEQFLAQVNTVPAELRTDVSPAKETNSSAVTTTPSVEAPSTLLIDSSSKHIEHDVADVDRNTSTCTKKREVSEEPFVKKTKFLLEKKITDNTVESRSTEPNVMEVEKQNSKKEVREKSKEASVRRSKPSLVNEIDDEKVEAMLSDFVDT